MNNTNSKKGIVWSVIVIIVIAAIIVGVAYNKMNNGREIKPENEVVQPVSNKSLKTYISPEYGIQFDYPNNFTVSQKAGQLNSKALIIHRPGGDPALDDITISIYSNQSSLEKFIALLHGTVTKDNLMTGKAVEILVAGLKGERWSGGFKYIDPVDVYLYKDGFGYEFKAIKNLQNGNDMTIVLDQILSTLKFTN